MLRRLFEYFRLAIREARFIRLSLLLSAGFNLLAWGLIVWFVLPRLSTNPFFALHYTVYFGVDRIGPPWRLGATPLFGTGLLIVNAGLVAKTYARDQLTGAYLAGLTVLLEALLLIVSFLNVLLNL